MARQTDGLPECSCVRLAMRDTECPRHYPVYQDKEQGVALKMLELWQSIPLKVRQAIIVGLVGVIGAVTDWIVGILDATAGAPPV